MSIDNEQQNPVPRFLTADLPGTGGWIKEKPADFAVEELPLYSPSGEGEHTFFEIRKVGLSTFQAARAIAQALGVSANRISYAGLKDAQAVTCQVLSVDRIAPAAVMAVQVPNVRVLWAERHNNKLRIGHLRGNRFTIRIRGVEESMADNCRAILGVLGQRGVPNRYGPQRFGQRGDSDLLGRDVVRKDASAFVRRFLGGPHPNESAMVQEARAAFEAGHWAEALRLLPHSMSDERRALQTLIQSGGDEHRALAAVPRRLRMFFVSAYQSRLFNRVLDARLQALDRVYAGDLAMKHPGRSVFYVEDAEAEQPRAARFEISPTGPLYGYKMIQPVGRQGELEAAVLAAEHLTLSDLRVGEGIKAEGERRALRFPLHEPEQWYDEGIMLRFWLPRGCYATAVLAEIMKVPVLSESSEGGQDVTQLTEL
jgi:tRNA pseudouridine13 synthase